MLVDFEYFFMYEYFRLEILHTCSQHRDGLIPKISWPKFVFIILGRVSKLVVVINFKYFFKVNLLALKFGTCVINIKMML